MPRPVRKSNDGESAGTRLAREALSTSGNLTVLSDMLDPSEPIANREELASFVPDTMVSFVGGSQVTGRPKFSQLAQSQVDSSPTSGKDLLLPLDGGRDDMPDQQPSQDPIEDDSEEDSSLARPKTVSFAKHVVATKTRGQKVSRPHA